MKCDVPVFSPSSKPELKATVTYKDFVENGIRFRIKKFGGAYSIFRSREDLMSLIKVGSSAHFFKNGGAIPKEKETK